MAVIRDVMPAFELLQPNSIAEAHRLIGENGSDGWVLAGGLDSFDWLKDRIKKPKTVIDLSGVEELRGIRTTSDGVEIGAMTTLTEVAQDPTIRGKYSVLAEAADHPDVEELYRRCVAVDDKISISTVYRTVKLFEDAGIIERHDFREGRARYEQMRETHHDHLINLRDGKVIEFTSEEIEKLQAEIARKLGFRLVDHRLELYCVPMDDDKSST